MSLTESPIHRNVLPALKKYWFHIVVLSTFSSSIMLLMVLDYLDIESFYVFNLEFRFLSTFKGRMFYLFFLWLLFLESIIDLDLIVKHKPKNRLRILMFLIFALIPLLYVVAVNFFSLDSTVLKLGQDLGVQYRYPLEFRSYALNFHWILCIEYALFSLCFLIAIFLAYKRAGLGFFSMSLSLLLGMSAIYTIDAFYPAGSFKPFEMLALPTAACAAAILDVLGYGFFLSYDTRYVHPEFGTMPTINGNVAIGWPCAGVHSLFLFTVIILLFFKRSQISSYRKFVYFIVGASCTYLVNVLRIVSYFVILWNDGLQFLYWRIDARYFHNSIGELYFVFWIFVYIFMIILIERHRLIERLHLALKRMWIFLKDVGHRFSRPFTRGAASN